MQLHSLLMACQSIFNKNLFAQLKGSELTMGHPRILDYLKEHNGENQKQIAVGCHIEPHTLTTILNGMEEKGIIERKTLNGNRRYFHVFLTEKGYVLQKNVDEIFIRLEDEAFKGFSHEEKEMFINSFIKIYNNISGKEQN